MVIQAIERELHQRLDRMPVTEQRQVLDFVRGISTKHGGVKGSTLLPFAGSISNEDLALMEAAIKADCELVDENGW